MNTKFDVGQRVTYPVTVRHEAKIDAIQIGKDGNPRYSVGVRMVEESELAKAGVAFGNSSSTTPDKPEPVKLYCVEDFLDSISRGEIYETDENSHITYDHGGKSMYAISNPGFRSMYEYLVPLVKRPAKAGEWVLPTDDWFDAKPGLDKKAYKVERIDRDGDIWILGNSSCAQTERYGLPQHYLVLDGYHGEQEE